MTASAERGQSARRLRVLMVTGEYPPDQGGVADYTRCLSEALSERHVSVDVLTTRGARRTEARPSRSATGASAGPEDGADISARGDDRVRGDGDPAHGGGQAGGDDDRASGGDDPVGAGVAEHRALRSWGWGSLRAISRAAQVLQPDIVHIQYQAAAYGMGPAIHFAPLWLRARRLWSNLLRMGRRRSGQRHDLRTVVTFHDLRVPYLFPKAGRLRSDAVNLLAGGADLAIATNAADTAELGTRLGPDRLALVPIGSNVPDRPPAGFDRETWRHLHGLPVDAALLVYFGFLNESKGARALAEALERLAAEGRDVRLIMIGGRIGASDPTNATYLESFEVDLERRGLGDRVLWTGHLAAEGVSAWFHAADVAALPYVDGASYRRGSLLAALEHGTPVVTTVPGGAVAGTPSGGDIARASASGNAGDERGAASASGTDADVRGAAGAPAAPSSTRSHAASLPPGVTAPPELEDRRSAMLVPPSDAAALAGAIAEVLDDASLAANLSRGARELSTSFAWDGIAARHVELYRRLTGPETGPETSP